MKLSIITVNWNNLDGLKRTFDSVFSQTSKNIEYIVIDAGSDDGSKELIEHNQSKISYWVSESDRGIYHGMNKGIDAATGDYCLFLNSGDHLLNPFVIEKLLANYKFTADVVACDEFIDKNVTNSYKCAPLKKPNSIYMLSTNPIPHQSTWIRTSLLKRYHYEEQFIECSDWALFFDMLCIYGHTYQHINMPLSVFYRGGISYTRKKGLEEANIHLKKWMSDSLIKEFRSKMCAPDTLLYTSQFTLSTLSYHIVIVVYNILYFIENKMYKRLKSIVNNIRYRKSINKINGYLS